MRCNQELYGHINCNRDVILGEKYCKFHFVPSLRVIISKLQAENERLKEVISYLPKAPTQPYEKDLAQRIQKLEAENAKLKECVEFYALTSSWNEDAKICSEDHEFFQKWFETLGGKRARKVLKELDEKL